MYPRYSTAATFTPDFTACSAGLVVPVPWQARTDKNRPVGDLTRRKAIGGRGGRLAAITVTVSLGLLKLRAETAQPTPRQTNSACGEA